MRRLYALLAAAALAAGCATTGSYVAPEFRDDVLTLPDGEVAHRVFLTGNTGDGETDAVLRALALDARAAGADATVVILGDVTADGLPPDGDSGRAQAEAPVRALIAALAGLEAETIVVPGDRDWRQGEDGLKRLETLLDDAFDADVLTPGDQAGGPREIKLAEGLRLIALDTAWWLLDPQDRPDGEAEDQDVRSPSDVARILEQIVVDRDDDRLVVVAHHPLISRGPYAGYRGNPLSGFVSRTLGTGNQDLASARYRQLRDGLGPIVGDHDRMVWAASHDRILMTYEDVRGTLSQQTYLVSGTGGGAVDGAGSAGALAVASRPGYQRLVYYVDGRLWAETVEVDTETGATRVAFRYPIAEANAELVDTEVPDSIDPADLPANIGGTVTTEADADFVSGRFNNGGFTRAVFGDGYRDSWKTPVEFPVIDMGTEAGGLVPVKRGGGLQTTSLRLLGGDGHEYGFRLLEKSGLAQVPFELRDGLVGDIVLDLRAAMAPYGALVASPLARAAGVLQPAPRIVYVPDDPRLGRYRETFGDRLALYEVRPDDDMSDVPGFEGVTDVVSAPKLREEMREDHDHRVDQRAYLRARLFDILIADWDRHADQWRWAAYEPGELDPTLTGEAATQGKIYRPIARDRDFAFYGIGGLIQPVLATFDARLQPIGEDFGSVRGLATNGFPQDRRFLNELSREDWREVTASLQASLTDAAIERAVRAVPGPIYAEVGQGWTRVLKARRDKLDGAAGDFFKLVNGTVDVIGSDEREVFEVVRQRGGALDVTVRSFKGGEPGRVLYRRTVQDGETDEVRIYALAGRDEVRVSGEGSGGPRLRVVGGAGDDVVVAESGAVWVYDETDGLTIERRGGSVRDRRSDVVGVNRYDPYENVIGGRRVVPTVAYRPTDGVILGATAVFDVPGFRLRPFAATHVVSANYSTATGGVAGAYTGRMRRAVRGFDLDVDALAATSRYARNFYGLGNGTDDLDDGAQRLNLARVQARAGLGVPLGEGLQLVVGPSARYADPSRTDSVAAGSPIALLPEAAFNGQAHVGGFARLAASTVLDPVNPRQGLRLALEGSAFAGAAGGADGYGTVGGEAVAYLPLRVTPQATLALRAGAEHLVGDFPFFDAAVLGGPGSVRGYRRERFAGRTAASSSAELRVKLFDLDAYVFPLGIGVLGFADAGRVWAGDSPFPSATADGGALQLGYGGGLWISVVDRAVVNLTVAASDEATLFSFGLGFAY